MQCVYTNALEGQQQHMAGCHLLSDTWMCSLITFMTWGCVHDFLFSRNPWISEYVYAKTTRTHVHTHTHIHRHTCLGKALERNTHQITLNPSSQLDFYFLYFSVFPKFPAMCCLNYEKVTDGNLESVAFIYSI